MARLSSLECRILDIVSSSLGCQLDDLPYACPDIQWHQLFLAIDRLSRRGELCIHLVAPGKYMLTVPDHLPVASHALPATYATFQS